MILLQRCVASTMVLAALQTAALAQEARHYQNARFNFGVDIPAGFLPQEPPANGDGLEFDSQQGGAVITASAIGNVGGDTMGSFMALSYDECVNHHPSYIDIHKDWAVLSCRIAAGEVLYQRSALRGKADGAVFTTVRMTYPYKDRARWDQVAVVVTRSMRPAPGG